MNMPRYEQIQILPYALRWLAIATIIGGLAGTASACLLYALDFVTNWREAHPAIIFGLPLAGMFIGWLYHQHGKSVEGGNNYLIDEIHDPQKIVPLRMAPLVLLGTIITHLFGGSAGREGTAVQMGGALADQMTHVFRFSPEDRRIVLMAGVSAGFASVFGTPLAGAVFGLEVLMIGRIKYDGLFPCFIAAIVAHEVSLLWGIHHTVYAVTVIPPLSVLTVVYVLIASSGFGIIGMLFANATHAVSAFLKRVVSYAPLRPFLGGIIVVLALLLTGTTKYIGLGIPTIVAAFHQQLPPWDFAGKFLFTVITLGSGFKGGEVTPLFYIGATMGNAFSYVLHLPPSLLTGLGFVAVFAGAANTPLASSIMAIELFGADIGIYAAIACVTSYLFSGHSGIYGSQRLGHSKHRADPEREGLKLNELVKAGSLPPDPKSCITTPPQKDIFMSNITILRCYLKPHAKLPRDTMWKRMLAPQLGRYLVSKAKEFGIEQAILHHVASGFLQHHDVGHDHAELPRLPQCLELIDTEDRLHAFVERYKDALVNVKIILLKGTQLVEQAGKEA